MNQGKPGLLVFQVTEDAPFSGYVANKEASEKKILRNAFVEGDVYIDRGDLLEKDEDVFLCFTDQVRDTFSACGYSNLLNSSAACVALIDPYMQLTRHCTLKKAAAHLAVVTSNEQTAQIALTVAKSQDTPKHLMITL
ncbi:hypothetical protein DUI87_03865 [Hirundo rustica rustica]|uniref:AMP-dependent synthetase/ligase domain-containing protein n=1 Tax=Hirundo rustica rustica TaxID=333673 RepID=A0A3M0L176_HIRRU|nr:hypothetical protein DUI87_03865 [Hirundo rustica rustica]